MLEFLAITMLLFLSGVAVLVCLIGVLGALAIAITVLVSRVLVAVIDKVLPPKST